MGGAASRDLGKLDWLKTRASGPILSTCACERAHSAGWSSLVARRAHNPEVGGSNPPPATKHSRRSVDQFKAAGLFSSGQFDSPVGSSRIATKLSDHPPKR